MDVMKKELKTQKTAHSPTLTSVVGLFPSPLRDARA